MYKLYTTINGQDAVVTVGVEPQVSFVCDPANTDYQEFLKFLEEGGQPLPAESE